MSYRAICLIAVAGGILAGCATYDQGWTGSGAEPFDTAMARCEARVTDISNEHEREAAL